MRFTALAYKAEDAAACCVRRNEFAAPVVDVDIVTDCVPS